MASRSSLAARENSGLPYTVGRKLQEFLAKAGSILSSAGRRGVNSWCADAVNDSKLKSLRGREGHHRLKKATVNCLPAELCRKKRVICGKKCYRSRSSLNHFPAKCGVRCKKCVPTC